jgi:hypothetical protein
VSSRPIPLSYVIPPPSASARVDAELVEMLSRGQMYWTSSPSQVYAEPKRLLALGWIEGRSSRARRAGAPCSG